jgi:hypothetical protein
MPFILFTTLLIIVYNKGMIKRLFLCGIVALILGLTVQAEPLSSPTWGFRLDLPEGYELTGGDTRNQFSFTSSFGTFFDISVYTNKSSASALADEIEKKLSNKGKKRVIAYNGTDAVVMELQFANPLQKNTNYTGWALCMELETQANNKARKEKAFLWAMAYGPSKQEFNNLHLSVLDSIEGGERDRRLPGLMTEYLYPRGKWVQKNLANTSQKANFRENDEKAAQSVVEREYKVMQMYLKSPKWQEAWKRFYRAIYKDSFDRLANAAFLLERSWNNSVLGPSGEGVNVEESRRMGKRSAEAAFIASKTLEWVQTFKYERDLAGSDFVNLVTAAQQGRGDCDSRVLLWAVVLMQSDIPAGIMVSREYSHAMGLANVEGKGARFSMKDGSGKDIRWLVAETTTKVGLGLIGETVSETSKWLGISLD